MVNIDFANCERVTVSVALANRARQSDYISQPPLVVYGGELRMLVLQEGGDEKLQMWMIRMES